MELPSRTATLAYTGVFLVRCTVPARNLPLHPSSADMLHALKSLLLRGVQGLADVEHIVGIATDSRSIPSWQIIFFARKSLIIAVEGPEGW